MRRSVPIAYGRLAGSGHRSAAACHLLLDGAVLSLGHDRPRHRAFRITPTRSAENVRPETHYEFFPESLPHGPPPRGPFAVDAKALRKEFLRRQAVAHPDLHPPDMKRRAEALSARINEAYKTLQDPLLRAQYLLSLQGLDVAEDETAKVEDQELLMSVLESQEEIEEATQEADLQTLSRTNDARLLQSVRILDQAFAENDMDTAKMEAVRLRYWVNIRDSIRGFEPGQPVALVH